MERYFIKSGLYGFLFGLAISILFVSYTQVNPLGNGVSIISSLPADEYMITILRGGIIGMFIGLLTGWRLFTKNKDEQKKKTYYLPIFFVSFVTASIFIIFL
ncbi:hypothetical protein SH601_16160 [Gracilibacillus sp. S3-1-1]|uniref:Uncharacterized protein n=1 Tax=Gracilibacillus pellucidus TaxID=3095368 RepID=A0ACC6M9Q2_9BACI|nr:hypothetical protein [Gracilibacillus sp. S3-1-1]MDX8047502.1 hypothetical protein [Gracilibacillus sp. S3-1-1]